MPYIKEHKREDLKLGYVLPMEAGDLNYVITTICQEYFKLNGKNYQSINDIVGALEGAKLEFYRRIAAPYEDVKIMENGDVY